MEDTADQGKTDKKNKTGKMKEKIKEDQRRRERYSEENNAKSLRDNSLQKHKGKHGN